MPARAHRLGAAQQLAPVPGLPAVAVAVRRRRRIDGRVSTIAMCARGARSPLAPSEPLAGT